MSFASLIPSWLSSNVSVLIPTTSPPIFLILSFNSFSLESSSTQGLHPLNQKFTTVTLFLENRLSSTSLPSRSFPLKPWNTPAESAELEELLLEEADVAISFSSFAISSSMPRIVLMSLLRVTYSSLEKESLCDSIVFARKSA